MYHEDLFKQAVRCHLVESEGVLNITLDQNGDSVAEFFVGTSGELTRIKLTPFKPPLSREEYEEMLR